MEILKYASLGILGLIVLVLIGTLLFYGPIWTIWSFNLLFGLNIPVNLNTWLAVVWLGFCFGRSYSRCSKS